MSRHRVTSASCPLSPSDIHQRGLHVLLSANSKHPGIRGASLVRSRIACCNLPPTWGANQTSDFEDSGHREASFPVVYGATESGPDHALDAELAVAGALEDLGFTTEVIAVASIETLPSRQPLLVFNLVDAINFEGRFAPWCRRASIPLALPIRGVARPPCSKRFPRLRPN
jgi:hypothetical protein